MKRFWSEVSVTPEGDGHGLSLDGRLVRTPGRAPLSVPSRALADAIAGEWCAVEQVIDPRAMPLTGLANAAIDRMAHDPAGFAAQIAGYAGNDLLCYRADEPQALVARQAALWDPLLEWARRRYDVAFEVTSGIVHVDQPVATIARIAEAVAAWTPFELAGLSPVVRITGSVVAGLALIDGEIDGDRAWAVGNVDEDWQIEQWGDDDIALTARIDRRRDFDAGVGFLSALSKG